MLKFRLTLVGLSLWLSLAQPGLCPCWMLSDLEHNHPHPSGHSHEPHAHDYVWELFRASLASVAPQVFSALALMLASLAACLWQALLSRKRLQAAAWFANVPLPPPRGLLL